jgi:hypothetical protein
MKISHSKRFDALQATISRCQVAAKKGNSDGLTYLLMQEYSPLMAAIEEDFEQLKTQFEAIGEKITEFEKSGDDLCEWLTQRSKTDGTP